MEETQSHERVAVTDPHTLHLFYAPHGTLRATVGESHSFVAVRLYQAAPLSKPGHFIALQDGKGDEIALVPTLDNFTPQARTIAQEEINRRYLTACVEAITGIKTEFGVTYWNVETNKGPRDFVVQSLSESCVFLSDRHLLLIDVDGNRFEITDQFALDAASRERLQTVL